MDQHIDTHKQGVHTVSSIPPRDSASAAIARATTRRAEKDIVGIRARTLRRCAQAVSTDEAGLDRWRVFPISATVSCGIDEWQHVAPQREWAGLTFRRIEG